MRLPQRKNTCSPVNCFMNRSGWQIMGGLFILALPLIEAPQTIAQPLNSPGLKVTASGNIRFRYPPHDIDATAEQAQYDSSTKQMVLKGHVRLKQRGNTVQGEVVICKLSTGQCTLGETTPNP